MDEATQTAEGTEAPENSGGEPELDTSLYPGLDSVPQEYRQHIDPILKEVSKNANSKFEDYNNQLKPWEPYQELGIPDKVDPETMTGLLGLYDAITAAENGEKDLFSEWWKTVGNDFELFENTSSNENEEEWDGELEENGGMTPEQIQEAIVQGVQAQMQPILESQQREAEEAELQSADANIDAEFEPIKKELGNKFTPDVEAAILKLGLGYSEESVKHGWMDYKNMIESAQGELFSQIENQPLTPERGGIANTSANKITDFKDAEAFARDYLKNQEANQ